VYLIKVPYYVITNSSRQPQNCFHKMNTEAQAPGRPAQQSTAYIFS